MCEFCDNLMKALESIPEDNTIEPQLVRTLRRVGKKLERDEADNYALQHATAAILNLLFLDEQNGGNRYAKYFPEYSARSKKKGTKHIAFPSEYYCQKPNKEHLRIYKTKNGVVIADKKVCGAGWTCPICGAKIAVRRNEEIRKILDKAYSAGKSVFLITFTAPHTNDYTILGFSKLLQKTFEYFTNSGDWKKLKKLYGLFGYIKAMETTLGGANGAHNHFHNLYIFDAEFDRNIGEKLLRDQITRIWAKSCIKCGLLNPDDKKQLADFWEHAISVKRDFDPNYISKQSIEWQKEHKVSATWTASEEMTLSKMKKGHGSFSPFGYVASICRKVANNGYSSYADLIKDCDLFLEYACAMKGRKQWSFSPNLRAWAGLEEEKTDKQIVEEMKDEGNIIGGLDREQWKFIRVNFLWKPLKKALFEDTEKAITVLNKVFAAHDLPPLYSASKIIALTADYCFLNNVEKMAAGG